MDRSNVAGKKAASFIIVAIIFFIVIFTGISLISKFSGSGSGSKIETEEEAQKQLTKLLNKVKVTEVDPIRGHHGCRRSAPARRYGAGHGRRRGASHGAGPGGARGQQENAPALPLRERRHSPYFPPFDGLQGIRHPDGSPRLLGGADSRHAAGGGQPLRV